MNFRDLVGTFECDKAINVETFKIIENDGSAYLPLQGRVQFEVGDTEFTWLSVKFYGMSAKGEKIERIGKLCEVTGFGLGFMFENTGSIHIPFYFFPVEFCGEKEINGKKNFLMIMNLEGNRVVVKLAR